MSKLSGRTAFAIVVVVLSVFALVHLAQSCAEPDIPFNDFSKHPDVPIDAFVRGSLGIVQPTFARSYLVVAYRYISGAPLTKDEQEAAQAVWVNRGIDAANIFPDYYSGGGAAEDRKNSYAQAAQVDAY